MLGIVSELEITKKNMLPGEEKYLKNNYNANVLRIREICLGYSENHRMCPFLVGGGEGVKEDKVTLR